MKKLTRDQVVFAMDKENPPVLTVDPGEQIVVETEDCFGYQLTSNDMVLDEKFDYSLINPATGPIAIRNSQPGDVLEITIENIEVASQGVVEVFPGWGPLGDRVTEAETVIVPVQNGMANFKHLLLPIKPMIGVIGVAPLGEAIPCGSPGPHGGNMDTADIIAGSKLYLPVFVPGANLALGDLHAIMGDGEVGGTGVEIRGEVTIKVNVLKNIPLTHPILEKEENYYLINSAATLDEAVQINTEKTVEFIKENSGLNWNQSYMLAGIATDLKISQVVNPLKTVRTRIPKGILTQSWPY